MVHRRGWQASLKALWEHVEKALGKVVLWDLRDGRIGEYIRKRQVRKLQNARSTWKRRIEPSHRTPLVAAVDSHIRIAAKRDALSSITLRPAIEAEGRNSKAVPVRVPVVETPASIQ